MTAAEAVAPPPPPDSPTCAAEPGSVPASGPQQPQQQPQPQPLAEGDIRCLGHLKRVFALLDDLHAQGTERDTAGNRRLFFDGYCKLVLLHCWNPLIDSVRRLQEAATLDNVAAALGVKRFSLGSFSEAPNAFDPAALQPIIEELAGQLAPHGAAVGITDPRLKGVRDAITLVDSTVLSGLGRLTRIAAEHTRCNRTRNGRAIHAACACTRNWT